MLPYMTRFETCCDKMDSLLALNREIGETMERKFLVYFTLNRSRRTTLLE